MGNLLKKIGRMALIIIILLLMNFGFVSSGFASGGPCEKGLIRCTISCGISLPGGLGAFAGCISWCAWGYGWCTLYYE